MQHGVTHQDLASARNWINNHGVGNQNERIYDQWFRLLKRAVSFGNVGKFIELMDSKDENWKFKERFEKEVGESILHNCCLNGRKNFLCYLLENGWKEEINKTNKDGLTPFFLMMVNKITNDLPVHEIIPIFMEYNCDIFAKNRSGQNILEFTLKNAPNSKVLEGLLPLFMKKERERSLSFFLFLHEYSAVKKRLMTYWLPPHYKERIMEYF